MLKGSISHMYKSLQTHTVACTVHTLLKPPHTLETRHSHSLAIGGDALLKAALHQLGDVTLLLHLRPSQGQVSASGSGFRVSLGEGLGVG